MGLAKLLNLHLENGQKKKLKFLNSKGDLKKSPLLNSNGFSLSVIYMYIYMFSKEEVLPILLVSSLKGKQASE